jgi:hypothetical protein
MCDALAGTMCGDTLSDLQVESMCEVEPEEAKSP